MKEKLKGSFVIPEGYEEGRAILSSDAIVSLVENFKQVPVIVRGLDMEAAKDDELKEKNQIVGAALAAAVTTRIQGIYQRLDAMIALELEEDIVKLLHAGYAVFDPVFTIPVNGAQKIGDRVIANEVTLDKIYIRRKKRD